ncbi:histone deacetylase hda1 [Trichophyton equinum CBS 127.97]|uniref:Histone deacetylase n=1 Tax=Trichophyton equinum (strain ATCC MYA-4606 / CBS 127.97) TaxID=559882 RepID=F2PZ43_TRIEC|nr:histone deacetylase hda1 [Trichophyton equinum CBS 127.97]
MDGDEDVVMGEARIPTSAPGPAPTSTSTIPIGGGRPSPPSAEEASLTPEAQIQVPNGSKEHTQSLLATFHQKVHSPGKLLKEIEDHQAGISTPNNDPTTGTPRPTVAAGHHVKAEPDTAIADEAAEDSDWSADHHEGRSRALHRAQLPTGYCYDNRMRYHCEVKPTLDVHPEDPRRVYYIYRELGRAGLIADGGEFQGPLVPQPLKRIEARDATEAEIMLVHTKEHYEFVKSTKDMSEDELLELEHTRDSIYFNSLTFTSALLSCGGAIETCKAVAEERVKNAIAVIRPPGHHAENNKTMGFCLFNNVSVAARACQHVLGDKCRKIMILDWDVHHGNGVQRMFYNDPNVLYISIHVYRDGSFYPGGDEGNWDYCGEGLGLGKNVNIPWPTQGMGDGDYLYAFQEVVMPIGYEFDPDLVIISAGFDAAAGDELGGCFVTPPCYSHMTRMLMNLANGKVAVCLEGGYNFRSISKSALAVTRTLMGEPPDRLTAPSASRPAVETVREVAMMHSRYWKCMYPKGPSSNFAGNRVHDIIRQYQAKQLYEEHKLTSLYIYRDTISKSFENQVLASQNYDKVDTLLVIFHDPPELMGIPHPVTNVLEAHNTWLADNVKDYISWAVEHNVGVIDVNIPKHISEADQNSRSYERESPNRALFSEQLAEYLWENYIETNDTSRIFFMGVGDAFLGLANLLINKERVHTMVSGVICFVAENPVRAVASTTITWLSKWYKEEKNSLVFVSHRHMVWEGQENKQKQYKRYGRLVKSTAAHTLNEMLVDHRADVFKWIEERVEAGSESSS